VAGGVRQHRQPFQHEVALHAAHPVEEDDLAVEAGGGKEVMVVVGGEE
jgi:hypothetical protein